ncbi:DUF6463 family protein [Citrobacter amalonaticus]|jgi:hypothetical protein|uniref:DUF6463 family protein n=1 Tax=Citrobacter amalonaticus TaxID=35703 RepID=UPI00255AAEF9|nr:DUF6463 family protein [Citrobacter amalonaticus]MDL4618817.1 DUF6463 family protein [Citrobacter amalonaticus]MDL4622915.1 DUF6463 family protein [Citrobacter amalonaticus]
MWKYSGWFLILTGMLHTLAAVILGYDSFIEIGQQGVVNAMDDNISLEYSFWFLFCGIIIMLLGELLRVFIQKTQQPAPKFLGYSLLVISIAGCILMPASGFWLFIPQALIILISQKKPTFSHSM